MRVVYLVIGASVVMLAIVLAIKFWRGYELPPTTEVAMLGDVTDTTMPAPNSTAILNLFDVTKGERWSGAIFRYAHITDVGYNPVASHSLPPANEWFSNELERDNEIKEFNERVTSTLDDAGNEVSGKPYSSVYVAVARQLKRLSESHSDKRVLVVYSDLMENTPELSFYDNRVFALLNERLDKIVQAWEAREKLPTLAGIEVYLVYQPKNVSDDKQFETVSALYRRLLESKGAVVYVSASLDGTTE